MSKYVFNPFTGTLDIVNTQSLQVETFVVSVSSNHDFVLSSSPILNTEFVFLNGALLNKGATEDYTITGSTISISSSYVLDIGDKLVVKYQ